MKLDEIYRTPRVSRNFIFLSTDLSCDDWERILKLHLPYSLRTSLEKLRSLGNIPTSGKEFSGVFCKEQVAQVFSKGGVQDIRLAISGRTGGGLEYIYQLAKVRSKQSTISSSKKALSVKNQGYHKGKEIHFEIPTNLLEFVCETLLRVGLNPQISVSRAEMRIDVGEMMHISFTPPSELTSVEIKKWLKKFEGAGLVFNIGAGKNC